MPEKYWGMVFWGQTRQGVGGEFTPRVDLILVNQTKSAIQSNYSGITHHVGGI